MPLDKTTDRIATQANIAAYDSEATRRYVDSSPHIKNASLRDLYAELAIRVYDYAKRYTTLPHVLDLGAGEGSVTLQFLELGARVTAVDASSSQLSALRNKCERLADRLEVRCEDIDATLKTRGDRYDIIVSSSFLHHVPNYLGMIGDAMTLLTPCGQFFSFQDPLRYDSVGRFTRLFSSLAFFSWRVFRGDIVGGLQRRIRRGRGVYLTDSMHDNAEYHVVRNGVDQVAILRLFRAHGFDCSIVRYFSTQSRLFQPVGVALGVKNTFAVIARRKIEINDVAVEKGRQPGKAGDGPST